jgi:hypothetical protein
MKTRRRRERPAILRREDDIICSLEACHQLCREMELMTQDWVVHRINPWDLSLESRLL